MSNRVFTATAPEYPIYQPLSLKVTDTLEHDTTKCELPNCGGRCEKRNGLNHHTIKETRGEEAQFDRVSSLSWRVPALHEMVLPTTGLAGHAYCEAKIEKVSHHDAPRYEAGHYTAHKVLVRYSRSRVTSLLFIGSSFLQSS